MNVINIAHAAMEASNALAELGTVETGPPLAAVHNHLLQALARLAHECPDAVRIVEVDDWIIDQHPHHAEMPIREASEGDILEGCYLGRTPQGYAVALVDVVDREPPGHSRRSATSLRPPSSTRPSSPRPVAPRSTPAVLAPDPARTSPGPYLARGRAFEDRMIVDRIATNETETEAGRAAHRAQAARLRPPFDTEPDLVSAELCSRAYEATVRELRATTGVEGREVLPVEDRW